MATNSRHYIKLAQTLPPRLTRFFARYPPQALLSQSDSPSSSTLTASTLPANPSASSTGQIPSGEDGLTTPSPFRAHKHPVTGKWHDPVFSLRRQAELVKLARQHGVEELLPHTVKGTEERLRRRQENGLRVKGTGVGQRVKGKESERTLKGRYVLSYLLCCLLFNTLQRAFRRGMYTNCGMQQIGEEKTGYARDAANDPDMERGKSFLLGFGLRTSLTANCREDMGVDGKSGRNKRRVDKDCASDQICILGSLYKNLVAHIIMGNGAGRKPPKANVRLHLLGNSKTGRSLQFLCKSATCWNSH